MLKKITAIILLSIFAISCSGKGKQVSILDQSESSDITVNFTYDSADLTKSAKRKLISKVIPSLKASNGKITIEGHCDERGSDEYNFNLGNDRAWEVKNYLVKSGIKAYRIKTVSYGKSRPVDMKSNERAWTKNRRAVTILAGN